MPRHRREDPAVPQGERPLRRTLSAIALALILTACVRPVDVLHARRDADPSGPYREEVCASPDETGDGWRCPPRQLEDLRATARALNRAIAENLRRSVTCSGPADCPGLIRRAFAHMGVGWRGHEAVRVAGCESGHNPRAFNGSSGASGLFQQLARFWPGRAAAYGMAGRSPFDPWANAVVSAGMVRDTGGWSHWVCRP